jgi:hypothetical protein
MTKTAEIKIHAPGSKEAHECLSKNSVIYGSDGQPMASIYFVFPHLLTFKHPHFKKKKVARSRVNKMRKIAKAIAPFFLHLEDAKFYECFEPHKDFILELDDEEICAMLNEACDLSFENDEHGDMIGYNHAVEVFKALQRLDDKFGEEVFGPHYTYNDPDSYCGQHDIQFCYPGSGDSIYGCDGCDIVFCQIHPGGDARNMAEGRFYMAEGIDDMTNLFDTLGASHSGELCTTVEIPVEFPLEQWIKQVDEEAWDSMYREEVKGLNGHYSPRETLFFHDFKDGMCRTQFSPKGDNGAGVDVYRCFDVACYKGRDFWTWTPEGEIIGEMRKMWGISATPWKPEEFKYSTGGYFKWEGPMPGTDEWKAMLEEHKLDPIEPRKDTKVEDQTQEMFSEEE